ncbi:tripartite tricarboxylate transporter substrate binding protein [Tardiphaga sp. vice352]|uniref:Bug family tripartite tricarboxylate transporter substrate binding protein n=3 Tax=Tardiphaga TaxID=1395974 RepID=UPI0011646E39|nr:MULTISPECIES: tripartite tricarboxylate transporter substrate binding protein [unclassified Tardiphaga]QDM17073.1 tripartite tricarboxylate transporter substrate binding protein [Tardiphaga sp. vice278]QDM22056.1 tripartite tricarboxylate transporter substrate binding protein [Tardiphaga sp. vice154]QDM27309.1 tripartite tricarboxylate transporter substrate binding protein [Tardiphaga sp. vice304]QDM32434.1 tripartite tricarboxylate transporter substrate binding protein [Tardiphaga sp. vice3
MNRILRVMGALAIVTATAGSAQAQGWPNRPIRMVVPYTPGGYTDLMARLVSQKMSEALGQTFVIENKPGANAAIGTDSVAKAAPDGYTFGTVIAAHSVNPTLNPKLPYDTMKDFTYVSLTSVAPLILIAHPSVPASNMKELIALAKAKPGTLNFASSGIGSAAHLTMEMLKSREGINLQHIPYKGTAGALQDLVGGQISVMFDVIGPLMSQVTPGNAKAIAVTAKDRVPAATNVATMTEQGVPDFVSGTWSMIIAPAGTPKEIVDRISLEAKKALSDPDLKKKLDDQGIVAMGSTPDEARAFVTEQIALWKKVIVEANIKLPE